MLTCKVCGSHRCCAKVRVLVDCAYDTENDVVLTEEEVDRDILDTYSEDICFDCGGNMIKEETK